MVRLTKIYTKTGDKGDSGLGDGTRRPKTDPRFGAIGTVDEANSAIGVARLHAADAMAAMLGRIQNDLFDLGADLSVPGDGQALRIAPAQVMRLESEIDAANADLALLRSFILPCGTVLAAHLHLARAVARRAERDMVALAAVETLNPAALHYINRLSDLLFVLARHANAKGADDVLWVPGENRNGSGGSSLNIPEYLVFNSCDLQRIRRRRRANDNTFAKLQCDK